MADDKNIEMLKLSAQIDALVDLPYHSVYKADAKLNELQSKSAVFMEDIIRVLNGKRARLETLKLKSTIEEQATLIKTLETKIITLEKK